MSRSVLPSLSVAATAFAFAMLAAGPGFAQQYHVQGSSVGSAAPRLNHDGSRISTQQTVRNPNQAPVGTVLGVPVVISAPVDAPYNAAAAYSTYAGQPGFGPNAVLADSVTGGTLP